MIYQTDTGLNAPETTETLLAQQQQLVQRKRLAQMFPIGTPELPLLDGFARVATPRGVFHYDPEIISAELIESISYGERENELLSLGPYNKHDVQGLMALGEILLVLTELTTGGIEVKAAVGTKSTIPEQIVVFERDKLPGSSIRVETANELLGRRIGEL